MQASHPNSQLNAASHSPRISFLMAAHNEERVIHHALDSLRGMVDQNVEVLVGLDGCSDGTREVVGHYDFVRCVELNERKGKPAVLRELTGFARGEVIIVHDADWRFVCDQEGIASIVREFEDPRLGGIILPPHNIPFLELREGIQCKGFVASGLGVLFLSEYLLQTQTECRDGKLYVDRGKIAYPFTVDVFRRGIIPNCVTAADDIERFMLLASSGYEILAFDQPGLPDFEITDQRLPFKDHFWQRMKGHIARAQITDRFGFNPGILGFHAPFAWYCLRQLRRVGIRDFSLIARWYLTILAAMIPAKIVLSRGVPDAREAWRFRVRRHGHP
jgi:glycosyltransferase involved in cell wall biosynthesis